MSLLRSLSDGLRSLFRKKRIGQELDEELNGFLEMAAEEKMKQRMSRKDALRAVRLERGSLEVAKEVVHSAGWESFVETCWQDLRFAIRMLRKSPSFTAVAVLTLALGIGTSSSVFSVVDRILFRSLPYPQDNRLVSFGLLAPIERDEFMLGSSYVDLGKQFGPFELLTAMAPVATRCDLTEQNGIRLDCASVEQTFLVTFGIQPVLGRNFLPDEDRPNVPRVALLGYSLWKSRFGGDPEILGKTISLDGKATRVVGVLPSNFEMPTLSSADILLPLALDEDRQRRANPGMVLRTFARLKPGIDVREATAALQPWFQQALRGAPPVFRKEIRFSVRTLRERQVGGARLASWLLFGAVLAFPTVACTNVANLLLARATGRQRELAVRAALGAGRSRLVRQTLTESLLLGVLGGTAGSWFAYFLLRLFVSIAPQGIPRLEQARMDLRVAAFAVGITLISAVIFGLAPALQYPTPESLIGKDVPGTTRNVLRQILVATQIAISLVLLAGASLLLRSLWNLDNIRLGMQTENVVTEYISLGQSRYPTPQNQLDIFAELEKRVKRLPGAISIALSDSLPPYGQMRSTIFAGIEVAGRPLFSQGTGGPVGWRAVTGEYFSALSISILQGRAFQKSDLAPSENSIILNETLARELFPNGNAIGQQLRLFRIPGPWRTVIGIAADVKNDGLTAHTGPEFYLPWKNDPVESFNTAYVTVRTQMNSKSVATWMREETHGVDSAVPVTIEAMSHRVS